MQKFFQKKVHAYYYKICMKALKKYYKFKKEKKRIGAYTRNTIHRNKMKRFLKGW